MNQNQSYRTRKYSTFQYQRTTYVSSVDDLSLSSAKNLRKVSGDLSNLSNNYKTQVCKYWQAGNQCPFKETCIFAHGGYQMRNKDCISDKYKTKLCKNFHEKGSCAYGKRCQFIHNNSKLKKIKPTKIYNWFGNELQILKLITKIRYEQNYEKQIKSKTSIESNCSIQNQLSPQFDIDVDIDINININVNIDMQNNRQYSQIERYEYYLSIKEQQNNQIIQQVLFEQGMTKPRLYSL